MNWILLLLGLFAFAFVARLLYVARRGLPLPQAMELAKSGGGVLVDVREANEWRDGTAKGAARLPFSDLRGARGTWKSFLTKNRGKKLLLYCASGTRSGMAAATLRREGFDAVNVGTFHAWTRAGWPVQRG